MSKRNQKPFEDHIESNDFDINPLIDAGTNIPHHVLHPRLEEWLDNMPQPIAQGKWDDELDNMQKRLRHSLAIELVQRGMLDEFAEQLDGIDDETLIVMMHYPITLALLSQDYFRRNGYPHDWELLDIADHDEDTLSEDMSVIAIWKHWAQLAVRRTREWLVQRFLNITHRK